MLVVAAAPVSTTPAPVYLLPPLVFPCVFDIDESAFEFEQFGKAICHLPEPFINVGAYIHVYSRCYRVALGLFLWSRRSIPNPLY